MNYFQSSPNVKTPYDAVRNRALKSSNTAIDKKTDKLLQTTIAKGTVAIRERLNALDKEIDIDRAITLLLSGAIFVQMAFALQKKNRNFLWIPLIQAPFLFMQASLGWSPSAVLFRKLGYRTKYEIQFERDILFDALITQEERQRKTESIFSVNEWDIYGSI